MKRALWGIAATITVATSGAAQAASWRLAGTSDEAAFFVDVDSVRRSGDALSFSTMSVFAGVTDTRSFDKSIISRNALCASRSSQIVTGDYYLGGKLIEHDTSSGEMRAHGPTSVMAAVVATACGDQAYAGPVVADPVAAGLAAISD